MKTIDNLLIQDLCSRLPYEVKVKVTYSKESGSSLRARLCTEGINTLDTNILWLFQQSEIYIKPYLFPLSENHEKEIRKICPSYGEYSFHDDIYGRGIDVEDAYEFYKYCYKNNIDFLRLIEKGLAHNATGLNIY